MKRGDKLALTYEKALFIEFEFPANLCVCVCGRGVVDKSTDHKFKYSLQVHRKHSSVGMHACTSMRNEFKSPAPI